MDSMNDLQPYALNGMDISRFTLLQVGNMNSIFLFCFVDKENTYYLIIRISAQVSKRGQIKKNTGTLH